MLDSFLIRAKKKCYALLKPYTYRVGKVLPPFYPQGSKIISDDTAHIFCGYYDVSPFNADGNKLLALRCPENYQSPHDQGAVAEIGYFDLNKDSIPQFTLISDTHTWNWQQGCRLQWRPEYPNQIVYNDYDDVSGYKSIIYDLKNSCVVTTLNLPIYALNPTGTSALSLDFSRLHLFRRGYGYHQIPCLTAGIHAPHSDGLWYIDILSEKSRLMVSLQDISMFQPQHSMHEAFHYINHAQWSPDGKNIIFFHLWSKSAGKKQSRLMMLDERQQLHVIDASLRPSHTAWCDNSTLMVTGFKAHTKNMYHVYSLENINFPKSVHDIPNLVEDGHPSFINPDLFLSDTYPDMLGMQSVFLANKNGQSSRFGNFYLPRHFTGELRCDTHPRLSHNHKSVAIDFIKNNKRAIAIMPVPQHHLE